MRTDWLAHTILALGVILFALPVWLLLAASTQPSDVIARGGVSLLPDPAGLGVYADIWRVGRLRLEPGGADAAGLVRHGDGDRDRKIS